MAATKHWVIGGSAASLVAVITLVKLLWPPVWHAINESNLDRMETEEHKQAEVELEVEDLAQVVMTDPGTKEHRAAIFKARGALEHIERQRREARR